MNNLKSIVVPVFNEEGAIFDVYKKIKATLVNMGHEIIFINDSSTDNTKDILNDIAKNDGCVKIVHFARNYGQTAAMMAGIDHAKGDIIIAIDSDGQNDPEDIPRLLEKIDEGYDVVSGWRKNRQDNAISRTLPSFIANKIISWVSGVKLHDYGCSLKAYRKEVIKEVRLYGEMHRFIPIYAHWFGAKVTEIPVNHFPRTTGKSKYGINRTFKVILDLMVVKFLQRYLSKPIYLIGGFGVLCMIVGLMSFFYASYLKLFQGVSYINTPLPLLSVMTILMGFLSVLLGIMSEILVRTYYEYRIKTMFSYKIKNHIL